MDSGQRPTRRILLKGIDHFHAHLLLEGLDWELTDAEYDERDGATTTTRLIHAFGGDERLRAVATEIRDLGLDFVDFFGPDTQVIDDAVRRLDHFTEGELRQRSEHTAAQTDTEALLLQLGLTARVDRSTWKRTAIERHLREGSRETRLTALVAATLALDARSLPAVQAAAQDHDPEIRACSAALIRVLEAVGDDEDSGVSRLGALFPAP